MQKQPNRYSLFGGDCSNTGTRCGVNFFSSSLLPTSIDWGFGYINRTDGLWWNITSIRYPYLGGSVSNDNDRCGASSISVQQKTIGYWCFGYQMDYGMLEMRDAMEF